jgi:hypothetical protein
MELSLALTAVVATSQQSKQDSTNMVFVLIKFAYDYL